MHTSELMSQPASQLSLGIFSSLCGSSLYDCELLTSLSINAEDGQPFRAYLVLQEGTTQHCWPSPSSYILIAGEVLFPFLLCCIPS